MKSKILSVVLAGILAITSLFGIMPVFATPVLSTDFQITDPLGYFSVPNTSAVAFTTFKSSDNNTESLSREVSVSVNTSWQFNFAYKYTAQNVSSGSAEMFVGYGTANYTNGNITSVGNYSAGVNFYLTGTGVLFRAIESWNGTNYYSSTNTFIQLNELKWIMVYRDQDNLRLYLNIYNDAALTSLNASHNLTLHGSPAYSYSFWPIGLNSITGTTSITGFMQDYDEAYITGDSAGDISITMYEPVISYANPFYVLATLNSTGFAGNVTDYGFQLGTAPGIWDYDPVTPITFNDPYNAYTNTTGSILASIWGLSNSTAYYIRAWAAGYATGASEQSIFYSATVNFTTNYSSNPTFTVSTTNLTLVPYYPPFESPAILTGGFIKTAVRPVIAWGTMVGNTSASVDNLSAATYVIAHSGNLSGIVPSWTDYWAYNQTWENVYARAYAIDNNAQIAYGETVSINTTTVTTGFNITAAHNVTGNYATFTAVLSSPKAVQYQGFGWGTTNNTDNFSEWYTAGNSSTWAWASPVFTLTENINYYYRAEVMIAGVWYYSTLGSFSTGSAITGNIFSPSVSITAAENISYNSFRTTLTVTGANLTKIGLEVKLPTDNSWNTYTYAENTSVGSWNLTVSGLAANTSYYYRGFANNILGVPTYSEAMVVTTADPASPILPSQVHQINKTFSEWLRGTMASWGMDNDMGHWAFMLIILIIVAAIYYVAIIYVHLKQPNKLLESILSGAMFISLFIVVGAFLFSGILGWWPVIILVFSAAGLVLVFGGNLLNFGRVRGSRA